MPARWESAKLLARRLVQDGGLGELCQTPENIANFEATYANTEISYDPSSEPRLTFVATGEDFLHIVG
jgi:hypothetical protein